MLVASALTVVGVMPAFLTGALAVQMRADLGFTSAVLGMTMTTFLGGVAVTALVLGRTVDRLGAARCMRASALLAGTATIGIAATPSAALLVGLLFLAGTGQGLGQTATNVFIVQTVDAERRGLAFGVKQSSQPIAALLGGLAVPVIALQIGWRWAFVLAALVAFSTSLIIPAVPEIRRSGANLSAAMARSRRGLVVAAFGFGCAIGGAMTVSVFLVDASVASGIAPSTAGLLLSIGGLASVAARLVAGLIADRRPAVGLRGVALMMLGGCAGYVLLATDWAPFATLGTVLALGLGWGFVGLFFHTLLRLYPDAPGSATAVGLTGGSIGGALAPLAFGLVAEHLGYQAGWLLSATLALVAGLVVLGATRLLHGFDEVQAVPGDR